MEKLLEFLDAVRQRGSTRAQLRGLLHLLIGRHITGPDGSEISTGLTWRQAATLLRDARWDPEAVRELGLEPAQLPVRDRERFWYAAIARANVDAPEAAAAADKLTRMIATHGYVIGPTPGRKAGT